MINLKWIKSFTNFYWLDSYLWHLSHLWYSNSKYLAKRTISDKILKDGAYETARNRGYDGYQRELASIVYKVFHKKTGSGISINEQLTKGLNKPVIKNFRKKKVYARFKDNILAADLGEI